MSAKPARRRNSAVMIEESPEDEIVTQFQCMSLEAQEIVLQKMAYAYFKTLIPSIPDTSLEELVRLSSLKPTPAEFARGHLYCYEVPFFSVTVTKVEDGSEICPGETWTVLKTGRADPGKLCTRLNEEARKYANNTCLQVKLPVLKKVAGKNTLDDSAYLTRLAEEMAEENLAGLVYAVHVDISLESAVRKSLGHELGKGQKKPHWENWLNLHDIDAEERSFVFDNGDERTVYQVKALNVGPTEFVLCKQSVMVALHASLSGHTNIDSSDFLQLVSKSCETNLLEAQKDVKLLVSLMRFENDPHPMTVKFTV